MALALTKLDNAPVEIMVDFPGKAVAIARRRVDVQRHLTSEQRQIKNERLLFCRQAHRLTQTGCTQAEAVAAVTVRTEQFPLLVKGGKGGSSALTLRNYRQWMSKLGAHKNGRPKWDNADKLADRYCTTVRERFGDPHFWQLFSQFYLNQNRLTLAEAHRLAQLGAARAGIQDTPTVHQVRYWMAKYADPAAVLTARMGRKWAEDNIVGYILRDWSAVQPGELLYGDHHQFDAPCRIWDEAAGKWRAVRPWLTAWQDAKTHYMPGWLIRAGEAPDSLAIEDALLMAIRANDNRPPVVLAIDNGKDYVSAGFITPVSLDNGATQHSICTELGCRHTNALPYNARSKLIEREFRTVCEQFAKLWPAYLGNRPANRPDTAAGYWEHPETLPSLQQFCEAFATWLQQVYHQHETESSVTGGAAPAAAWAARAEITAPLADEQLFFAFLKPVGQPRTVGRGAAVRFANRLWESPALWPHFGHKIMLKVDRFRGRVYAFTLDGKLICPLETRGLIPGLVKNEDERRLLADAMRKYRKQMTRARTIARDMTGTRQVRVISPADRLELDPHNAAAQLPTEGSPDQNQQSDGTPPAFFHHRPAAGEPLTTVTSTPADKAALQEFQDIVFAATGKQQDDDAIDEDSLAMFDAIIAQEGRQRHEQHKESW